ncbi:hypothetical protein HHI36_004515 [Cryptolaemus montrouzieri]|uniref:C2H2-type domain-containing protein n=1 Tax=Cryptolaemus montrouzieri TaxID=559131 RepID=A0ABD2NS34_9CUCU
MIEKLPQSEVRKEKQTPTTSKLSNKRKLRSSFRKVIDRVKKLKLDNPGSSAPIEPAKDMNVRTLNSFLGQGTKEKEQLATVLVPLVEEPKENPPSTPAFVQNAMDNNSPTEESLIPENIFNLDHNSENLLQAKSPLETSTDEIKKNETKNLFETITEMKDCKITEDYPKETKESETEVGITVEITKTEEVVESLRSTSPAPNVTENSKEMSLLSIETSSKSDKSPLLSPVLSPSMLSPKMKGKLRKPNRGLNDCIAMLTKKAFEETHKEESAKPIEGAPVEDNKNIAHKFVRENECILKIPVFQGEKQKYLQDEVLDLSKPKKDLKMKIPSSKSDAPDLSNLTYPQFWNSVVQTNTESIHSNNSITKEETTKFWNPMNNSIPTIIPKVISEKAILKIPKIVESSWNSVDDIIQKVVENSCESSVIKTKIPLESKISSELLNSIDKIIEEVVKGDLETNTKEGRNENFNCMIEKASPDLIEDKMSKQKSKKITRKIKFAKQKCFEEKTSIVSENNETVIKTNEKADEISDVPIIPNTKENNTTETEESVDNSKTIECEQEQKCAISDNENVDSPKKSNDSLNNLISKEMNISQTDRFSPDSSECKSVDFNRGFMVQTVQPSVKKKGKNKKIGQERRRHFRKTKQISSEKHDNLLKNEENVQEVLNTSSPISNPDHSIGPNLLQENEPEVLEAKDIPTEMSELSGEIAVLEHSANQTNIESVNDSLQKSEINSESKSGITSSDIVGSIETLGIAHSQIVARELSENKTPVLDDEEPIILEEKVIAENVDKSILTDSEDELPLVVLKNKSKFEKNARDIKVDIPSEQLVNIDDVQTHEKPRDSLKELVIDTEEDKKINIGKTIQVADNISSPLNKLITGELPFSTEPEKEKDPNIDSSLCESEVTDVKDSLLSSPKISKTKKNIIRRSPRKLIVRSSTIVKKIKCIKSKKSKNSVKTKLGVNFSEEVEDLGEKLKDAPAVEEDVAKDLNADVNHSVDSSNAIPEEKGLGTNETEEENVVVNELQQSMNDSKDEKILVETSPVPILRVTKIKSRKKSKNREDAVKTKLILKLPKIILKEPILKIKSSDNLLENYDKKNEETGVIINLNMEDKPCSSNDFTKLIESTIRTNEPTSGITLKLKSKNKKKGSKHKKKMKNTNENVCSDDKTVEGSNVIFNPSEASIMFPDLSTPSDAITINDTYSMPLFIASDDFKEKKHDVFSTVLEESVENFSMDEKCILESSNISPRKGTRKKKKVMNKQNNFDLFIPTTVIDSNLPEIDKSIVSSIGSDVGEKKQSVEPETFEITEVPDVLESETNILPSSEYSLQQFENMETNSRKKSKTRAKKYKSKNIVESSNSLQSEMESDILDESISKSLSSEDNYLNKKEESNILSDQDGAQTDSSKTEKVQEPAKAILRPSRITGKRKSKLDSSENSIEKPLVEMPLRQDEHLNKGILPIEESKIQENDEVDKSLEPKDSRTINLQNNIEETPESIVTKPARSLRSTLKITYKQSNIFALQIESEEVADLKKTENSKSILSNNLVKMENSDLIIGINRKQETSDCFEKDIDKKEEIPRENGEMNNKCQGKQSNSDIHDPSVRESSSEIVPHIFDEIGGTSEKKKLNYRRSKKIRKTRSTSKSEDINDLLKDLEENINRAPNDNGKIISDSENLVTVDNIQENDTNHLIETSEETDNICQNIDNHIKANRKEKKTNLRLDSVDLKIIIPEKDPSSNLQEKEDLNISTSQKTLITNNERSNELEIEDDFTINNEDSESPKKLNKTKKSRKERIQKHLPPCDDVEKSNAKFDNIQLVGKSNISEFNDNPQVDSPKVKDAFEFEDDLIPIEKLSPQFKRRYFKDPKIPFDDDNESPISKNIGSEIDKTPSKRKSKEKLVRNLEKAKEFSLDSSHVRKHRNAKTKALENINALEKKIDQSLDIEPQQEDGEEKESISLFKRRKDSKRNEIIEKHANQILSDKSREVKTVEIVEIGDIITPRKSRLAKAKAIENIKILEKRPDDILDEETNVSEDIRIEIAPSIIKESAEVTFPYPSKDWTKLLEENPEAPIDNLENNDSENVHKNNGDIVNNTFLLEENIDYSINIDSSEKLVNDVSVSDTKKRKNSRINPKPNISDLLQEKEISTVENTRRRKNRFKLSESIDETNNSSEIAQKYSDTDIISEISGDELLMHEEIEPIDKKDSETAFSSLKEKVNDTVFQNDTSGNRKSRLAKSKALENINDLKKIDVDLPSDIDDIKYLAKTEKNTKTKYKLDNLDNKSNLTDISGIVKAAIESIPHEKSKRKNKKQLDKNIPGYSLEEKIVNAADCYDINKIDDDPEEPVLFTLHKNKNIQTKEMNTLNIQTTEKTQSQGEKVENSDLKSSRKGKIAKDKTLENVPVVSDNKSDFLNSLDTSLEATIVEISSILKSEIKPSLDKKILDDEYSKCITTDLVPSEFDKSAVTVETSNETWLKENKSEKTDVLRESEIEMEQLQECAQKKRCSKDMPEDERTRSEKNPKLEGDEAEEPENKRRSRRACKVNTYNENELAEAIFLQASADKEKEKSRRKKENLEQNKTSTNEKKMNSDELFDLLKATATENFNLPKPGEETSPDDKIDGIKDFTDDNFDDVFDDILKKSQELFKGKSFNQEKSDEPCRYDDSSNTSNFNSSHSRTVGKPTPVLENEEGNDTNKSDPSLDNLYCDICKKSFKRIDNLVKHRSTLTHISKLSEIEAKQAENKLRETLEDYDDSSKSNNMNEYVRKTNESDSLYSYPPTPGNDALKIAEIITGAFEKPAINSDNFSEIVPPVSNYRRYKSLGERKSFESDQGSSNISENLESNIYGPHITNNAGVILEKQITLLQNIIENRGLEYIDDISMSSYHSLENSNHRDSPVSIISSKLDDSNNLIFPQNNLTSSVHRDESENFLKPPQIEDVSEDSVNLKIAEDVKARKVLNRDEELFLECCSLLKSSSEVSNFSKKSNRTSALTNVALKMSDEPDMFESKNLVDKVNEESTDYSRMATPLGDSFGDTSDSNTISSNWGMNKDEQIDKKEGNYFNFRHDQSGQTEGMSSNSTRFKKLVSRAIKMPFRNVSKIIKSRKHSSSESSIPDEKDFASDSSSKMPTKGALKVFEGLKVSIPTEELNLAEVLNNSPPIKKVDTSNLVETHLEKQFLSPKTPRSARKSKPVKNKQQIDDRFIFKVKKKSTLKDDEKTKYSQETSDKISDVYDFEETQDNTDVFAKPDFKTFRTKEPEDKTDIVENNSEGQTLSSSSSSTTSNSKKPKTNECITKKKHMIMGRIFKNALKPKMDEEIRDIPIIDHNELVENYVLSCNSKVEEEFKRPKMTEEEMNYLFDKLLDTSGGTTRKQSIQNKIEAKTSGMKKKLKTKCKKRQRSNSDSTDDEFGLNKIVRKRPNRKNAKEEDNSINLEQELKECIGVASRKSQRKCTSGKQNVLVEYWSSDESAFEAFLENHLQELSETTEIPVPKTEENCQKVEKVDTNRRPSAGDKDTKIKSKVKDASIKKKSIAKENSTSPDSQELSAQSHRRKRTAAHPLYHWSSSSEDEMQDLIEVKSIRDDPDDEYDEDRPVQHGWIVGDSPKKLVTMLAQAKGKKTEPESSVKEQGKKKNSNS